MSIRVTVWNEFRHEKKHETVKALYPDGIHQVIAGFLAEQGHQVETVTLDEPEHGLTEAVLAETDVLIWWGHAAHREVEQQLLRPVIGLSVPLGVEAFLDGGCKNMVDSPGVSVDDGLACILSFAGQGRTTG